MDKKTFAIDFDGTIVENKYPDIGEPNESIIYAIRVLHSMGHTIILNTCRVKERLNAAVKWLKEKDVPIDYVNDNSERILNVWGENPRKISADYYVDDKNLSLQQFAVLGIIEQAKLNIKK